MKRTLACIIILLLLSLLAVIVAYEKQLTAAKSENGMLAKRLASLEPETPQVIASLRTTDFPYSAKQVLTQGELLDFRTLEIDNEWQRPVYIPLWHTTSWKSERFCYLPRLVENNRHRVFLYQGGGSYWFDLSPAMGFTDDTSPMGVAFKTRDEVAVIALESRIKKIVKKGDQMTIMIEPCARGYHIVALSYQLFQNALCQVVTPEGFPLETLETATSMARTNNSQ